NTVVWIGKIDFVKYIERLKSELPPYSLSNQEILEQRHVRVKESRTRKRIAAASKMCDLGTLERTVGSSVRGENRDWSVKRHALCLRIEVTDRLRQAAHDDRPTRACVFVGATLSVSRCPRQTTAP